MKIPFEDIQSGTPFLTVNKRLARTIHNQYDLHMKEMGLSVWDSPSIMPFSSWLRELWTDHSPEKFLLSPLRSLILWENLLTSDKGFLKESLLSGSELAATAYDAYKLVKEYELDLGNNSFSTTEESLALQRWSFIYEKSLKELNFIDYSHLPFELIKLLESKSLSLPPKIIMAGFDEVTPLVNHLLSTFEKQGSQVSFLPSIKENIHHDIQKHAHKVTLSHCSDESDEVRRAAIWIRNTYKKGMKIAVLVPALNRYKNKIIKIFNEELAPSSVFPWLGEGDLFNISLGSRLYDEPIVRSAINLLAMDGRQREIDEISEFLLSPYLGSSPEEMAERARLDAKLRRENRFNLTIKDVLYTAQTGGFHAPLFISALAHLVNTKREANSIMLPGEWSEFFSSFLIKIHWPANASLLSSLEYQALQSFSEALSSLASLDDITGPVNRGSALKYLTKITKDSIFQAESEESPVKVMGFLESAGLAFDAVWLLGAHDGLLPGQPSPNPFIPFKLQKDNYLPKSTFDRELKFSKIHLQRILSSTGKIIFSFPERVEDRNVNISPLISVFGESDMDESPWTGNRLIDKMAPLSTVKQMESEKQLKVKDDEPVKGGTAILKNQSDCPFRAFAIHRLGTRKPDDPQPGISPMERGSIIHRALEDFWKRTKNDRTLRELEMSGRLHDTINDSCRVGLGLLQNREQGSDKYKNIELERLSTLLNEWVKVELKRNTFKAMESESSKDIHLAGLDLSSRIDRIDRINENEMAIIDYKTGSVSTTDWAGDRPREPQLMLYASSGEYDAILFARLKRGDCRFTGIAKEEGLFPGVKAFTSDPLFKKNENINTWEDLMENWKEILEGLARDFLKGKAVVDPRDYARESSACKYCEHSLLCRIFERNMDY